MAWWYVLPWLLLVLHHVWEATATAMDGNGTAIKRMALMMGCVEVPMIEGMDIDQLRPVLQEKTKYMAVHSRTALLLCTVYLLVQCWFDAKHVAVHAAGCFVGHQNPNRSFTSAHHATFPAGIHKHSTYRRPIFPAMSRGCFRRPCRGCAHGMLMGTHIQCQPVCTCCIDLYHAHTQPLQYTVPSFQSDCRLLLEQDHLQHLQRARILDLHCTQLAVGMQQVHNTRSGVVGNA